MCVCERERERQRETERGQRETDRDRDRETLTDLIKLYFSTLKILVQRPTHLFAIATVLLIIMPIQEG